jgi:predicted ABC-class ATPase
MTENELKADKKLVEFVRVDPENREGNARTHLRVAAYVLKPEEQKEVRKKLEGLGFSFDIIGADSVEATLYEGIIPDGSDTINSFEILKILKQLESEGWSW